MKPVWPILALLAFCPVASTQTNADVIVWTEHIYSAESSTDWNGATVSKNITRPHNYTVLDTKIRLLVSMSVVLQPNAGVVATREFEIAVNGIIAQPCTTHVAGGITQTATSQRAGVLGSIGCVATPTGENLTTLPVIGSNQTWTFTRSGDGTVTTMTGNVYVVVEDTISITRSGANMTHANHILETIATFAAPAMALLLLSFARRDPYFYTRMSLYGAAVLAMILATVDLWSEIESLRILFIVFILYILGRMVMEILEDIDKGSVPQ